MRERNIPLPGIHSRHTLQTYTSGIHSRHTFQGGFPLLGMYNLFTLKCPKDAARPSAVQHSSSHHASPASHHDLPVLSVLSASPVLPVLSALRGPSFIGAKGSRDPPFTRSGHRPSLNPPPSTRLFTHEDPPPTVQSAARRASSIEKRRREEEEE